MKKSYFLLAILVIMIMSALVLVIITPSNRWVCREGQWQAQGEPNKPKPKKDCVDEFSIDIELKELDAIFNNTNDENDEQMVKNENINVDDDELSEVNQLVAVWPQLNNFDLNQVITSPYQLTGEAPGSWYFEASFPVVLKNSQGDVILETYAQAESDWMTTEMVPFVIDLIFEIDREQSGELILRKDNPSGLVEHDAQISYPIILTSSPEL